MEGTVAPLESDKREMDYEITPEEVKAKLDAGAQFTLLDVREPWEFEASRIEGAKLIPMGEVPSRAHQELDPEDHVVVVCHHGVRSMNVTVWLRQQGFEKAQSMRGGIDAWSRRVDGKLPMYPNARNMNDMPAAAIAMGVPLVLETADSVPRVDAWYTSNAPKSCTRSAQSGGVRYQCAGGSIMIYAKGATQIAFVPTFSHP